MANIKSAIKRAEKAKKLNLRNRRIKSSVRTAVRKFVESIGTENAEASLRAAISQLDRAASKGTIHKNTAARKKARLSKRLAALTKSAS
jgi:small subunit ribosomal protein S20